MMGVVHLCLNLIVVLLCYVIDSLSVTVHSYQIVEIMLFVSSHRFPFRVIFICLFVFVSAISLNLIFGVYSTFAFVYPEYDVLGGTLLG
jgi:hypothetical protein